MQSRVRVTEGSRVRTKEQAGKGGVAVGACYRLPGRAEAAGEALTGQVGAASCSRALVLMGDFGETCWRDDTAGHKQPRRLLRAPTTTAPPSNGEASPLLVSQGPSRMASKPPLRGGFS